METLSVPEYTALLRKCLGLKQKLYFKAHMLLVDFYWDLGNEVSKAMRDRKSPYGDKTIIRLAKDMNSSKTTIYDALKFRAKFKKSDISQGLTWSHYKALLALETKTAQTIAKNAEEKGLLLKELNAEIISVKETK